MNEEWRPIDGWPYEVSSCGRVRRASGEPVRWYRLGPYKAVWLRKQAGARPKSFSIHRLICVAWHGLPPPDRPWALHRNDVPDDLRPDNLYWGTPQDNVDDMIRHGKVARGDGHGRSRLTDDQCCEIRRLYAEASVGRQRVPPGFLTDLAIRFGASRNLICQVGRGKMRGP